MTQSKLSDLLINLNKYISVSGCTDKAISCFFNYVKSMGQFSAVDLLKSLSVRFSGLNMFGGGSPPRRVMITSAVDHSGFISVGKISSGIAEIKPIGSPEIRLGCTLVGQAGAKIMLEQRSGCMVGVETETSIKSTNSDIQYYGYQDELVRKRGKFYSPAIDTYSCAGVLFLLIEALNKRLQVTNDTFCVLTSFGNTDNHGLVAAVNKIKPHVLINIGCVEVERYQQLGKKPLNVGVGPLVNSVLLKHVRSQFLVNSVYKPDSSLGSVVGLRGGIPCIEFFVPFWRPKEKTTPTKVVAEKDVFSVFKGVLDLYDALDNIQPLNELILVEKNIDEL